MVFQRQTSLIQPQMCGAGITDLQTGIYDKIDFQTPHQHGKFPIGCKSQRFIH